MCGQIIISVKTDKVRDQQSKVHLASQASTQSLGLTWEESGLKQRESINQRPNNARSPTRQKYRRISVRGHDQSTRLYAHNTEI